ncbi:MAG: hypothetical protein ACRDYC_08820 [Acidimicrobiales bacterium]
MADPAAAVWHHQADYVAYMRRLGGSLPPSERLGVPASPGNRRRAAVAAWARESGVLADGWQSPDWRRLTELGL